MEATRSAEQEVIAIDDARITAAKASDIATFDAIYAQEFKLITQTGLVRTKQDQIRDYGAGTLRYGPFELLEREVRIYSSFALVWSRERSVILLPDGQDVGGDRRITRVYVNRDGRWQLISAHASSVQSL
ncbi:MAG TPA: nuclear transport factor 2 family protein [Terriglobia bacterium]|nr:nuclear transport factor 2 family protein [Terriglobia bacterium]